MRHRMMVFIVSTFVCSIATMLIGCRRDSQSDGRLLDSADRPLPGDESEHDSPTPSLDEEALPRQAAAAADSSVASVPNQTASQPVEFTTDTISPAESALKSIFSPSRAPERRTMGLLQRTFLDIAADGDRDLEVAIVVDGTDSMAAELAGVRKSIHQMLGELRKFRNGEVRAAIVVYRDAGSPSGPVVIPKKAFTADQASIEKAIQSLTPESGAPFFHELPDLGLYQAINELQWSQDDQVTKWILLFGDAPPYSQSRSGTVAGDGKRRYGDNVLIGAAKAKGIRINCILCTSGSDVSEAYEKSIEQTRTFMSKIASETAGLMLDLSDPQTQTALADAAKNPEITYTKIRPITAIELASVRRDDVTTETSGAGQVKHVRVAVLPHMPLAQIRTADIDPSVKAVQVSTALRSRLSRIAGVSVASPVDIQHQLRRLRLSGADPAQTLRGLASRLGVDYVVWGEEVSPASATYRTAAYRRDNGQRVVQVDLPGDTDQGTWAHLFLTAAAEQSGQQEPIGQLMRRIDRNDDLKRGMTEPMAKSATTTAELLNALESLDQSLQYDTRSEKSRDLLEAANAASKSAAVAEPGNAMAHWLQANVAYNQAAHLFQQGEKQLAGNRMKDMKASLSRAINLRERLTMPSLLTEVQADYLLLVSGETQQAVESYEALTLPDQPLQSQLRGHWMLSGIYAGDWGSAGSPIVDPERARLHVMQILSNWPDSPQARLLKRWLKFDETTQQTEFNYLPMVNLRLTGV
jgi:hypothetical protein